MLIWNQYPCPAASRALPLAAFVLLVASLSAQQATQPPPQAPDVLSSPILKSRTDLVLVPVVVSDKHGNHIPGLTKDAFRLEENGKDQFVSLFEEVHAEETSQPTAPTSPDRGYSNLPFDAARELRLTILLLDLLNSTQLQRADGKDDLIKFLNKGLARNQPVSLLCLTPDGLQLVHPFTSDTASLIQALKKFPSGGERLMPRKEAARETLKQFQQIAQAYTGIPGRKTLIFAAGTIPDPQQLATNVYDNRVATLDSFQQTWNNLIDANIAVYPVQLMAWAAVNTGRRGTRPNPPSSGESTLRQFADATGGNRCLESNEVVKCMAEAVEDSRSYYLLGFSVSPDDRKPGWRDLKVKVSAEHANVRARNGFYFGNPGPANSQPNEHDTEIAALASPLAYSAVPMYVRVLPPASTPPPDSTPAAADRKVTVEFLITIPLSSIKIDPGSPNPLDLDVDGIALTRDVREAGEFLRPLRGHPKPEALQEFAREGIKLREKLELPPGFYDVRILARDNNANQIGTVVFPVEVK
jgi:VWFA-related protein